MKIFLTALNTVIKYCYYLTTVLNTVIILQKAFLSSISCIDKDMFKYKKRAPLL